jgi:hypothetical protein
VHPDPIRLDRGGGDFRAGRPLAAHVGRVGLILLQLRGIWLHNSAVLQEIPPLPITFSDSAWIDSSKESVDNPARL